MKVDSMAFDLGVAYATGQGKPQDDAKALTWYCIAASSGHAEALQWVRQTADQGSARARVALGNMYSEGYGVPKDAVEAVQWYRLAAEQGHAEAQLTLGGIYTTGKVGLFYTPGQEVARDPGEAVRWYRRAAEQGDAEAQQILGIMYAAGRGVAQDDAEALRWQLLSAEQGNAREQFLLGLMYARGRVVPKDHEQAMEWFGRAAEQGVPIHAEFRVPTDIEKVEGFRYDKSVSARQHNAKVLEKIQDLAGVGPNYPQGLLGGGGWNTRAQFNLGVAHAAGCGVPQDDVQALVWFNVVAVHGSRCIAVNRKLAVAYRELLACEMTPPQLADAERRTREWRVANKRERASYGHEHLRTALYLEAMEGIEGPTVRVQTSSFSSGEGKEFTVVVDDKLAAYRRRIQAEVSAITNKTSDTGNILLAVNEQGTYTRTDGSFLDDGFAAQNVVEITGFKHKENNGRQRVSGVTARVLSVDSPEGFKAEQTVARIRAFGGMIDLPFE